LSFWVWVRFFGLNESEFPPDPGSVTYTAQSPTRYSQVEYDEDEIWRETERVVKECEGKQFSIGQNLYFQIPFFANPQFFFRPEYDEWIEDVQIMASFNIPLSRSLDEAPAFRLEMYNIIKQELNACQNYKQEKNAKR